MNRILHVGAGPLGQRIISDLVHREVGHLVGVVDINPALADMPLSRLVPSAEDRLRILPSIDAVEDWDTIDAVIVATTSDIPSGAPLYRELLSRGKAVISTCEELIYPWLRHVALAEELDDLARRCGGRILGTGVNPGFLMDALPVYLTCASRSIRAVSCSRVQDASLRRIPFQQKIGAGLDDEQFEAKVKDGSLRHVGLGESLHFIAHYIGIPIERWEEDINPVHATRNLVCGLGDIPKGRVAGVRQRARAYHDERVVVQLDFQAAIGQDNPHDRIIIDGDPGFDLTLAGGIHGDIATASIIINAVPRLVEARPGLHTMATIAPPSHWSAAYPRR
ncbi:MAG: hypothetical protein KF864_00835 [Phycisphaeraceae bacterium]|nr:hypothetical protein [Phycisphaeraceae bacterium]MBX3410995.1 hypothetical protein [Phycisphaeraceae bacterium]